MSAVLNAVLEQLVLACTSVDEPTREDQMALQKYMEDQSTLNLVYAALLDRAAAGDGTDATGRCIKFLRTSLAQFVPNNETLMRVDAFCRELVASTEIESLATSANFLRALIAKHFRRSSDPEPVAPPSQAVFEGQGASSASGTPQGSRTNSHDLSGAGTPAASAAFAAAAAAAANDQSLREEAEEDPFQDLIEPEYVIPNVLQARPRVLSNLVSASDFLQGTPPLLRSDLFGGHFKREVTKADSWPDIVLDDPVRIENVPLMRQRIAVVKAAKKREEQQQSRQMAMMRRNAPQLFVYKFYAEQAPLDLPFDKLNDVVNTLMDSEAPKDDRKVASVLTIKVMMDQYCAGDENARQHLLSLLFELLEGLPDSQVLAFNLLFNVAVHANMYDEYFPKLGDDQQHPPGHYFDKYEVVTEIMDDLYDKLCEMLLWILHRRVPQRSVWMAALSCILMFICDNGRIHKEMLLMLDARIIPALFTRITDMSDVLRQQLVRMLVNFLYPSDAETLDEGVLEVVGGIDFVIQLYASANSSEVKDNLFAVIFDYCLLRIGGANATSQPPKEDALLILEVLSLLEAPATFASLFVYLPPNFAESLLHFVYMECLEKDKALQPLVQRLNKSLFVALLHEMNRLASDYHQVEAEFRTAFGQSVRSGQLSPDDMNTLKALAGADREIERRVAATWIFELMRQFNSEDTARWTETALGRQVESLLSGFLLAASPRERHVYLTICHKQLHYRKSKIGANWSEANVASVTSVINDRLSRVIAGQERDDTNLVYMFNMIYSLLAVDNMQVWADSDTVDLDYDRFLNGQAAIPYALLKGINISIFHRLFALLTKPHHDKIHAVLLVLMIEQCRVKIKLESIDGVNFFKGLVDSRDPVIAYHASRYLVEQSKAERPEQYRQMLSSLLSKAQEDNDERLLDNPYVQMKAMLEVRR